MIAKISYRKKTNGKSFEPFKTADVEFTDLHKVTAEYDYSNLIWGKNGKRESVNFKSANLFILDFDGKPDIDTVKDALKHFEHVLLVTSKSHQKPYKVTPDGSVGDQITPADYFHIVIGLDEPITDINLYKEVITNLINEFGSDPSCKDGARFYFPNKEQEYWYL